MRNPSRAKKRRDEERSGLIRAAIDNGFIIRKDICNATGLTYSELRNHFTTDRELYYHYTVVRKSITEMAADNIHAIVADNSHPQHFQASKYVLEKYKSDFDEILESQKGESINVELSGNGKESRAGNVTITFGRNGGIERTKNVEEE